MRIAVIHIAQETNDFNPKLTTLNDYRSFGILEGAEVFETMRGYGQVGGYLQAVEDSGLQVESVPIIRAYSLAGGRISREAFEFFQEKIREGLTAAGPIDGLALQLHGACAADGVDDVEGAQVELCRSLLGKDVPIVLGLDHHANVTRKIIDNCDAIVGHRTQPHDTFDTGVIGAELLLRIITEKLEPVMAWRKIPLVSHQEQFLTSQGPMKIWFDRAREMEKDPRVLQASNYPMQPWLDVAEGGWSTIVVTNGDQALAEKLADELADLCWSLRDAFQVREAVPVDEAVLQADAAEKGVVIISDTGDTVFGGAGGDSNVILEAMLRLGIKGKALVPMISPAAAHKLAAAGEGAEVTLALGGDTADNFFQPLEVTGIVRKVGGGVVKIDYNQQSEVDIGCAVIFEIGPVTMLITELRGVAGNVPSIYRVMGVEPKDFQMAVLKTASNFQYFAPIASRLIRADTRGPGQSDVMTLPWRRVPRPMYPLEHFDDWRAHSSQPGEGVLQR
ncbi:M81 family metallopeptidase [Nitratireductor pacificus]|uniref:Microcystin LR degradation protein MlrC-like protein n=1 Tax=Nitratireductor pacificus pht-3B TaxID=391937 RepID=K2MMN8_9HYPH|nr:M81 family metallopeptidase [Nitratireductor pacificus]EKF18512.1 microcystin LR degradation protein MlrC-like protein [Nitratireductor pacificus pht-3B]